MAHVFPYPSTVKASAFLSELGYIFEEILGGLVLYQPDRPSAFIKAFAAGNIYEGEMRGESVFNKESATMYMKILAGPIISELLQRVLELPEDNRPRNKVALQTWIAQNIDVIGAKIDQASVRIASSVKGIAARKRVSRMKADPSIRDRANAAIASGSYGTGASSKAKAKAAKQAILDHQVTLGGVLATDTNASTVGRGEEKQVTVDEGAFEEYIRKQAELQREAEAIAAAAAEKEKAAQEAMEAEKAMNQSETSNETAETSVPSITETPAVVTGETATETPAVVTGETTTETPAVVAAETTTETPAVVTTSEAETITAVPSSTEETVAVSPAVEISAAETIPTTAEEVPPAE
jgi:hypothetical protein